MIINRYDSYVHIDRSEGEQWSQLAIKVLQQENNSEIVSPRIVSFNGEERMLFSIDGLTLEGVTSGNVEHNKRMMEAFVELIGYVDSSEFLKRNNILLRDDMLYWSQTDDAPKFIIVPLEYDNQMIGCTENSCWEKDFIFFIRKYIDFSRTVNDWNISRIRELCETEQIDKIDEIIQLLKGVASGSHNLIKSNNMTTPEEISVPMGTVVLKYQGEYGHFVLYDKEPVYKIGKANNCQGIISFNPTVSREHCVIEYNGNSYSIMDLNSSNGTYLNGERIYPNDKKALMDGDVVVISNMTFKVVIEN